MFAIILRKAVKNEYRKPIYINMAGTHKGI